MIKNITVPKILVVDSKENTAVSLAEKLEQAGYIVMTTTDGYALPEQAAKDNADVLILNISLPICDEWEIITRMQKHLNIENMPVVVVTKQIPIALKGWDNIIVKPNNFDTISKTVKRYLIKLKGYKPHGRCDSSLKLAS